jgi:hypothetical protein
MTDGMNAQEACRSISSEADNIRARGKAAGDFLGIFNPKNWGTSNEVQSQIKNILQVDMSTDDITNIKNTCNNIFTGVQVNSIDTTQCPICQREKCNVTGVRQTNIMKSQQVCGANAIIDRLKKNGADFQSLAAIKAIQDAKGVAAGNTSNTDICNYASVDMSSKSYMELMANCGNTAGQTQLNELKVCGDIIDVLQKNDFDAYQKCITGSDITDKEQKSLTSTAVADANLNQEAEGTDLFGLFKIFGDYLEMVVGGSILCTCISCCCCLILAFLLFGRPSS